MADLQEVELVAVVLACPDDDPLVLTIGAPAGVPRLPAGPLQAEHRSLQFGLRSWVERQTGHPLGYIEQLYTFADRERGGPGDRVVSVSYLALTIVHEDVAGWRSWYELFPWEDRRTRAADRLRDGLVARLIAWADAGGTDTVRDDRGRRVGVAFGLDGRAWVPEACLSRYELLWEAGLVPESSPRAGEDVSLRAGTTSVPPAAESSATPGGVPAHDGSPVSGGVRMVHDHRRILATGMARLRAKIQYRPVVFELLPEEFTLGQLQRTVEALAGTRVHKQNFRRLVEQQALVEETGGTSAATGGRPAKLVRFRREVLEERQAAGTKLPIPRGS